MNSSFRSLLALGLALCAGALNPFAAHASFAIMPMETQLKMPQQGSNITDEIEVFNGGDTPLHISSSVMDWKLTPDGEYQYAEAGTEKSSCAKWIQLNPPEFNVAPKKSVRVRYSITPTETLTDERRAMIFFASRPIPAKGENKMGLLVATRMGCKVFVSPAQPLAKSGVLSDMELQNTLQPRVRVSVKNPGAATFRATGTVQVSNETGKIVAQGALKSAQVVPQAERNLWFNLPAPLPAGNYLIRAVIDYGAKQNLGGELKTKVIGAPTVSTATIPAKG